MLLLSNGGIRSRRRPIVLAARARRLATTSPRPSAGRGGTLGRRAGRITRLAGRSREPRRRGSTQWRRLVLLLFGVVEGRASRGWGVPPSSLPRSSSLTIEGKTKFSGLFRLKESVRGLVKLLRRHFHGLLHLPRCRADELGVAVLAQALVAEDLSKFMSNGLGFHRPLTLPTRFSADPATGMVFCLRSPGLLGTDLDVGCPESPFAEIVSHYKMSQFFRHDSCVSL